MMTIPFSHHDNHTFFLKNDQRRVVFLRLLGAEGKFHHGVMVHYSLQQTVAMVNKTTVKTEYDRRTLIVVIAKSTRVCLKWCIGLGVKHPKHPSNLTISCPQPELSVFRRHLHHSPLGSPTSEDRQILPILSARQHRSPHQDLWRSRAKRRQQCWMSWG
jgi:hypothetical protein